MRKKIVLGISIALGVIILATTGVLAYTAFFDTGKKTSDFVARYFSQISEKNYDALYDMISERSQSHITKEEFTAKNKNIYEGIEAENLTITVTKTYSFSHKPDTAATGADEAAADKTWKVAAYDLSMTTAAGELTFSNYAVLSLNQEKEYRMEWAPQAIFPELTGDDKVRVNTYAGKRGNIYDRRGDLLAGEGTASSVGLVPGKMNPDRQADIQRIARLLEMSADEIHKQLNASYVQDNTFVPLKTVAQDRQDLKDELLTIPGILINDRSVRSYPLGIKASHLTGYIQSISAEELESLPGQGYHTNSLLGKAGAEKLFEEDLRARDGCEIIITDNQGNIKTTVLKREKADGADITLTIDAQTQIKLYDQFSQDKASGVALNPKTGEVLALVSTPSYDANTFVLGMTQAQWAALNDDKNQPMFNRFRATFCPGSSFKPLTAAIAVDSGAVAPDEDFGHSGLVWKKDSSWGNYSIVTTQDYNGPATIVNALRYSDNIYFGKAALKIGADTFAQRLLAVGFEENLPFDFSLTPSTFSPTQTFTSEIQLADSGYGQGQVLINPLHLASVYSSFVNKGSMIQPYLLQRDNPAPTFWKANAFKPETADVVRSALVQVVQSGTATDAQVNDLTLGGKTGTAEIKLTVDDASGTELGWFVLFHGNETAENPLLVVGMVEDVKGRGGSHYVVPKVRALFE